MFRLFLACLLVLVAASVDSPLSAQTAPLPDSPDDVFVDASFRYVGPSRGGRVTTVTGHRSLARIDNALEQTDREQLERSLQDLRRQLETDDEDSYPPPMLVSQLSYLSGMTSGADQRPGRDAPERLDELESELDSIIERLDELIGNGVGE